MANCQTVLVLETVEIVKQEGSDTEDRVVSNLGDSDDYVLEE